jgi:glutamine amidotransferase
VDLSNCQPFQYKHLLGMHNGSIEQFRKTLYRPLRDRLCDAAYQTIEGCTDSEHIFALLLHELEQNPKSLTAALNQVLTVLRDLAAPEAIPLSANLLISDGKQLVASRVAVNTTTPSLYWLRDDPMFP